MTIGNRIQQVIDFYKCSQAEFARNIGAKYQNIQKWTKYGIEPKEHFRTKMCEVYNISRKWLDTGEGTMEATPPPPPTNERELGRLEGEIKRLENEVNYYRLEVAEALAEIRESRKKSGNSNHVSIQHCP